jgi:hypothetical protein
VLALGRGCGHSTLQYRMLSAPMVGDRICQESTNWNKPPGVPSPVLALDSSYGSEQSVGTMGDSANSRYVGTKVATVGRPVAGGLEQGPAARFRMWYLPC